MKKIIVAAMALVSMSASALNLQIRSPANADRLGLVSEIHFKIDCSTQKIDVVRESNVFVARQVRKYSKVICYQDNNKYDISMRFGGGKNAWAEKNMLATDPGRHIYTPVVVQYQ